jgi:hypothetical protein
LRSPPRSRCRSVSDAAERVSRRETVTHINENTSEIASSENCFRGRTITSRSTNDTRSVDDAP